GGSPRGCGLPGGPASPAPQDGSSALSVSWPGVHGYSTTHGVPAKWLQRMPRKPCKKSTMKTTEVTPQFSSLMSRPRHTQDHQAVEKLYDIDTVKVACWLCLMV
uniref:Uncharacterized protein n=1 Tax=Apteryx owenii TaxID=8824 RepID=A0A8B9SBF6_APTOW